MCSACSLLQNADPLFFRCDSPAPSSGGSLVGSSGPLLVVKHVTGRRDRTVQTAQEGHVTWYSIIRRHDNAGSNAVDSASNRVPSARTSFSFIFFFPLLAASKASDRFTRAARSSILQEIKVEQVIVQTARLLSVPTLLLFAFLKTLNNVKLQFIHF